ncbi:MAG: hypothetical protein ACM3OF_10425 [Gemmatimonas sp.]|jgi:hypothetical protein
MTGLETCRPAARYKAQSALFLLLLHAPYRTGLASRPGLQDRPRR